jgi:hypothetical protein
VHAADDCIENIQKQTPANLPPHRLPLKEGAIVMMTKNYCIPFGLANGTRLQIREMHDSYVKAQILTGPRAKSIVEIPRVKYTHGDKPGYRGTAFSRVQFPLRLAFAMTTNRAQGQTLNRCGLALHKEQCFSHGQFYVAVSRVKSMDGFRLLNTTSGSAWNHVYNPVYHEVVIDYSRLRCGDRSNCKWDFRCLTQRTSRM